MADGAEIRRLRKGKKYTQQELADLVGVTKTTVLDWEKGRYFPKGENLTNLAKALDVRVSYLLGETEISPKELTVEEVMSDNVKREALLKSVSDNFFTIDVIKKAMAEKGISEKAISDDEMKKITASLKNSIKSTSTELYDKIIKSIIEKIEYLPLENKIIVHYAFDPKKL